MDKIITVFISYTHDSEEHKSKVLALADRLNKEGLNCWIDRYVEGSTPERGWPLWMEEKVRLSMFVLVVGSENYLCRYEGREGKGKGLGGKFESVLVTQILYENDSINAKFIPIIFDQNDEMNLPLPLRTFTRYNLDNYKDYESLYRRLTGQIKIKKPTVGKLLIYESNNDENQKEDLGLIVQGITIKDIVELSVPDIPELTNKMNPGLKIVQAFFQLPIMTRFKIAKDLGLLEEGESYNSVNKEEICTKVLIRAKERNRLVDIWEKLFDSSIDPNPFK